MNKNIANTSETVIDSEVWRNVLKNAAIRFATSVLDEEIQQLQQEFGVHRWGSQDGYIRAIGGRISVQKPRIRHNGKERALKSYKQLQGKNEWSDQLKDIVLGGLAQRHFDKVGTVLGEHYGLSKSQVSRTVSVGLRKDFDVLMNSRCDDIVAIMIDGKTFGKKPNSQCLIAVLGINQFGAKRIIGIASGTTENSTIVGDLLDNLTARGLKEPQITVIDGSKALRAAIDKKWPEAMVARCQVHKKRNLLEYLNPVQAQLAMSKFNSIVNAKTYHEGYELAVLLQKELAKYNESAANSFKDGLEEMLVPLLISDRKLRRFFSSTNPMESINSMIETKTTRVRRWRNANQIMYWIATAHRQQVKNFNKIKGYQSIGELARLKECLVWEKKLMKSEERRAA